MFSSTGKSVSLLNIYELVELLNKQFKLKKPDIQDSIVTIQRNAGQRDVIDYLEYLIQSEKEDIGINY